MQAPCASRWYTAADTSDLAACHPGAYDQQWFLGALWPAVVMQNHFPIHCSQFNHQIQSKGCAGRAGLYETHCLLQFVAARLSLSLSSAQQSHFPKIGHCFAFSSSQLDDSFTSALLEIWSTASICWDRRAACKRSAGIAERRPQALSKAWGTQFCLNQPLHKACKLLHHGSEGRQQTGQGREGEG